MKKIKTYSIKWQNFLSAHWYSTWEELRKAFPECYKQKYGNVAKQ